MLWLSLSPEATRQLPLFGYTVYVVLRVSKLVLPGPALLGLNRQHLVLMDPISQVGKVPAPVLSRNLQAILLAPFVDPHPRRTKLSCLCGP